MEKCKLPIQCFDLSSYLKVRTFDLDAFDISGCMQLFDLLEFISSGYGRVLLHGRIQLGTGGPDPSWKITSGYRFTKKYWYRPTSRVFEPIGSNFFVREFRMALCEIR